MTISFVKKGEQCGLRFDGSDEVISNLYVALRYMKGRTVDELDLECFDSNGGHLVVGISPFSIEEMDSFHSGSLISAKE